MGDHGDVDNDYKILYRIANIMKPDIIRFQNNNNNRASLHCMAHKNHKPCYDETRLCHHRHGMVVEYKSTSVWFTVTSLYNMSAGLYIMQLLLKIALVLTPVKFMSESPTIP